MDYTSGGYSVTFQPNSMIGSILCSNIPITDDVYVEQRETFGVSASSTDTQVEFPVGSFSTVSIADNDSEYKTKLPKSALRSKFQ